MNSLSFKEGKNKQIKNKRSILLESNNFILENIISQNNFILFENKKSPVS